MYFRKFGRRRLSFLTALPFVLLCAFSVDGALTAQQRIVNASVATPLIVEHIDENRLVALNGNTRPEARAEYDRGQVVPELPMSNMILVLRRSKVQQSAFDAFVASQYLPSSPNFHRWLTPEEVGEKFGPAQSDIATVTQWLQSRSFSVTNISKDHLSIRFSGSAKLVQSAFHTEIHHLQIQGVNHIANMSDPQIPSALTPVVVGIQALHNFFPHPLHLLGSQVRRDGKSGAWQHVADNTKASATATASRNAHPLFGTIGGSGTSTYPVEDIAPYDFAAIYNVLPLWNASTPIDGTGQRIAIVGTSNINLADVATFRSSFGLPANVPTVVIPDSSTDPGTCGNPDATSGCFNNQVENSLDVEWAGAIAKNASIILVASSTGNGTDYTSDPVYISADYIIENQIAPIMNVSYGECEALIGTAGNAGYNTLWQTAASEGIAVFVATGDEGSPTCDAGQSSTTPYPAQYGLSVSGLASTPYNTAVGGTDFNWGSTAAPYWNTANDSTGASAADYIPEVAWNQTCTNPLAVLGIQTIAQETKLGTVTDAESACNFIYNNYQAIKNKYSVDVSSYVKVAGGGGGLSSCTKDDLNTTTGEVDLSSCSGGYSKPIWQAALTPSDGKRDIPDISFFASDGFLSSAYLICVSAPNYDYNCTYSNSTEPLYEEVGGTSVASPVMAGIMALINQKTGVSQGNPNTELYALASEQNYAACSSEAVKASSTSCIFNDVDSGTIAMPCLAGSPDCTTNNTSDAIGILSGYSAVKGYDLATGLGSANVANLVNGFASTAIAVPAVTLTPASLTFASTSIGQAAVTQVVVLKNTGNAALTVSSVLIAGADATSFSETDNCVTSLAVFASCTITVTFNPTTTGSLTALLNISDDATASATQTIALAGTGVIPPAPVITIQPSTLTFASTTVGTAAATQTVTVGNTGTAPLSITNIGIGGAAPASFLDTHNCTSVAVGSTCAITVTFKPTAIGTLSAFMAITDNAPGSPQKVVLTGTGVAVVPPPGTYTLTASAVSIASAGASGTSTVTALPANGYTGTVTLTCALATAPASANTAANPTCLVGGTIGITGASGGTATLTIATIAPSSTDKVAKLESRSKLKGLLGGGGAMIAGILLFGIPVRRRKWQSILGALILCAALSSLSACGGGSRSTVSQPVPGTTAGPYTYTISGTGNDNSVTKATTTLTVTVN